MRRTIALILLTSILLPSCNSTLPTAKPEQLTVQYTAASVPWLASLYNCAGANVVTAEQRGADFLDPQSADVVLRIGQPANPTSFAYQIGTEKLLVIVNSKNPSSQLTSDQVNSLFTGQIQNWKAINGNNAPVQAWVFPAGEDIQKIFRQTILGGSPVTSAAHLANSPDEMMQAVVKDVNAIGMVTQRWNTGDISGVYISAGNLPVLAITLNEPQGTLAQILACMQK